MPVTIQLPDEIAHNLGEIAEMPRLIPKKIVLLLAVSICCWGSRPVIGADEPGVTATLDQLPVLPRNVTVHQISSHNKKGLNGDAGWFLYQDEHVTPPEPVGSWASCKRCSARITARATSASPSMAPAHPRFTAPARRIITWPVFGRLPFLTSRFPVVRRYRSYRQEPGIHGFHLQAVSSLLLPFPLD